MLIEVVTKPHGPRLHRPDHHKSRQGHRVVTAIDVLQSSRNQRWVHILCQADPGGERNILLRRSLGGMHIDDLPSVEFAFPGPRRDRLVAAILSGEKTSTSALALGYERENEPLPVIGQLSAVVDSAGRRVAVIELTDVRVVRLADVDLQHVLEEGEGDESVAQWRAGHEEFWHSAEVRAELGDHAFTVDDDTLVLAQRFRLVDVADL